MRVPLWALIPKHTLELGLRLLIQEQNYEYDVITRSSAVKLRAQLETISCNGRRKTREFIAIFIVLTVVIYIEEYFTLKLAILCQKMPEKKDVDFRRAGTLKSPCDQKDHLLFFLRF